MLASFDDDPHGPGDPGQLTGPGIRDHRHLHRRDALPHGSLVLKNEAPRLPLQTPGDQLQRDVGGRALDRGSCAQHLPLAGSLEIAVETLVEKQAAEGPSGAVIRRLRSDLDLESSTRSHRCLRSGGRHGPLGWRSARTAEDRPERDQKILHSANLATRKRGFPRAAGSPVTAAWGATSGARSRIVLRRSCALDRMPHYKPSPNPLALNPSCPTEEADHGP